MAIDANEPQPFTVQCTGDFSKKSWFGKFSAKPMLSHKDRLNRDRARRKLLGDDSEHASDEAKVTATIFSELSVRLVKCPDWWIAADMGQDLADMNLVGDVYRGAMKVEEDYLAELAKDMESAKEVVKDKLAEVEKSASDSDK